MSINRRDPVAKLVDLMIREGLRNGASQIHFRNTKDTPGLEVVYQNGTEFREVDDIPERLGPAVIVRLKIEGKLVINTSIRVQHSEAVPIAMPVAKGEKKSYRYYEIFIIPSEYGEGAIIQFLPR